MSRGRINHQFRIARRAAALGAVIGGALALVNAVSARASNLAVCHFHAHITLNGGVFSSDGQDTAACTGLISSGLAGSDGQFGTRGSYDPGACMIDSGRATFYAQVPQAVYFIDPQYAQVSGSYRFTRIGQTFAVAGAGTIDGQPVSYMGDASFSPDGGQACGATGGTMTENITILDGGTASTATRPSDSSAKPGRCLARHHRRRKHARRHHRAAC